MDLIVYSLCKKYAKNYTDESIRAMAKGMHYKGSVGTYNSLPVNNNELGDLYTISDTHKEFIWTINASSGTLENWEEMGGVDLSPFVTDVEVDGVSVKEGSVARISTDGIKEWVENKGYLTSVKTINGEDIVGDGNVDIVSKHTFPNAWNVNGTTEQFCNSIVNDEAAVPGMIYMGKLMCSDMPGGLVQGEATVEVISKDANGKAIRITLTSVDASPYRWEYERAKVNGNYVNTGWNSYQLEINNNRKLNADLITNGVTNKVYTNTEKVKLSGIDDNAQVNVIEGLTVDNQAITPDENKNLNVSTLYIVDYANPNFAEAVAAFNNGKMVVLKGAAPDTNSYAVINYVNPNGFITFSKFLTSRKSTHAALSSYYLSSDNTWSTGTIPSGGRDVRFNAVNANVAKDTTDTLTNIQIGGVNYAVAHSEVVNALPEINIDEQAIYLIKNNNPAVPVSGLIGTRWILNNVLDLSNSLIENTTYKLKFEDADGGLHTELSKHGSQRLKYEGGQADVYNNVWSDVKYQTITITGGDDVNNPIIRSFLEQNGTLDYQPSIYSYDAYIYVNGEWRRLLEEKFEQVIANPVATLDANFLSNLITNTSASISNPILDMSALDSNAKIVNITFNIDNVNKKVALVKNDTNEYVGEFYLQNNYDIYLIKVYYNGAFMFFKCGLMF